MNLPNKLTLLRIFLVPLMVIVYLALPNDLLVISKASGFALKHLLALIIFSIASITDLLDGKIARKYNMITSFGKFADPIADKLLVNTLMILLVYTHEINVIAVLLMIGRDLIVDALRMMASSKGKVVSAGIYGKAKTVLQMFALIFVLLKNWPFSIIHLPIGSILVWAATAMSLYSGFIYFMKLKKYVLETM
ncbi:MAG: CDP-diacylglycerol--glycerol-3-phosphate 3-phosphatidyltransferase [Holdemanella sp.]|nr:CDP-diacylglycerol--glycerol-3-phosphate 3-phosphatidyltransferase [Holdemanella sp.]